MGPGYGTNKFEESISLISSLLKMETGTSELASQGLTIYQKLRAKLRAQSNSILLRKLYVASSEVNSCFCKKYNLDKYTLIFGTAFKQLLSLALGVLPRTFRLDYNNNNVPENDANHLVSNQDIPWTMSTRATI